MELSELADLLARKQRELALLDKLNELDPNLMERLTRPGANTGSATRDAKSQASTISPNHTCTDSYLATVAQYRPEQWQVRRHAQG